MRSPWYAGLFLVVTLTILALFGYASHLREERDALLASSTEQALELAGAKRALLVKPKEVVRFVEVPVAIREAVRSGALVPVTAAKVTATSEVLAIPCPEPEVVATGQPAPATPRFANIRFGMTGEIFVGKVVGGAVESTATIKATVFGDDGFHAPVNFKPEDVDIEIVFSKEVTKAIESYQRSWLKKHMAFACPGVGITYNPLNARPVDLALTCGYSVVWF